MSVPVSEIPADRVKSILARQESHFCDMKAKEIAPSKLTRTISAFANADGGEVYVGIAENSDKSFQWDGFARIEDANAIVQLVDHFFPIGSMARCDFLHHPSMKGYVLLVEIDKTTDIRYASDKTAYLRRGAQNLAMNTPDGLLRLKLNKGLISHEDQTVQLDTSELEQSERMQEFIANVVPNAAPPAWLRKQRLVVNERPVVAGVLLFADEPQVALPKASIKIYRYKTSETAGTRETLAFDPVPIDGDAYSQIYAAVERTKSVAEEIPILGDASLQKITYPTEAIHEVITNAVIHRDYSLSDDIHIRIFDNRIEVQSPGRLPGHVTPENILEERAARNPKLVRLLNKFKNPPNKDVGEGLNTAFEAMRKLKLKDPAIQQLENSVLVSLRHEKLGTPEDLIIRYLRDHPEINNSIARRICFIGSENTVKRIFQKMIEAKLIKRVPGRPLNKTGYVRGPRYPRH